MSSNTRLTVSSRPVKLTIEASADNGILTIDVIDNGPGLMTTTEGIGLATQNISERLERLYDGNAALTLRTNKTGGVTATLSLPLDTMS